MIATVPVHAAFAQYPGEPKPPGLSYDPVRDMQYNRQLGNGALDGVRNPQYLRAIWNFQKAKGLPTTTHLYAPTLAALNVPATGAASPRLTPPNDFADPAASSHLDDVEAP